MHTDKFLESFIEFIKENLEFKNHIFIVVGRGKKDKFTIPKYDNVIYLQKGYNKIWNYPKLFKCYNKYTFKADKIIIHSFIRDWNLYYFYFYKEILFKCYWVIWGSDLYVYKKSRLKVKEKIKHYFRKVTYSRVAGCITYIKGDYFLSKEWYGVKGRFIESFMYPSNLHKEFNLVNKEHETINIQIGNSADPSNNHIDVLNQLKKYSNENIKIYVPLSYGSKEYSEKVIKVGNEIFKEKFIPFVDFFPFDKYLEFLASVDVAIFAHKRQQAMGNIISLLGLGKKVYMRSDITPWNLFKEKDIKVYDINEFNLELIDENIQKENKEKVKEYFSKEQYLRQLRKLFGDN